MELSEFRDPGGLGQAHFLLLFWVGVFLLVSTTIGLFPACIHIFPYFIHGMAVICSSLFWVFLVCSSVVSIVLFLVSVFICFIFTFLRAKYAFSGCMFLGTSPPCVRAGRKALGCGFRILVLVLGGKFLRGVELRYVAHQSRRFWESVSG